jgi:NAD(P)-dependent dehydrogenase (short-subunit alcohol dehydrogenase family)
MYPVSIHRSSSVGVNFTLTDHHDTYPAIDPTKADLSGKTVLITGASRGVGKATAISFAKAGASGIALGARSSLDDIAASVRAAAKESGRPQPKILTLSLDVVDRKSVEAAKEEVSKAFDGKLDVLINNAGYISKITPMGETDPDDWWRDWEVNIKGTYLMSRTFLPLLLQSSSKTAINISSIGAHMLGPGFSAYQVNKLAMLRFTEFLMVDHGAQGLLALGVHPGGVKSDLSLSMPDAFHQYLIDEPELSADFLVWLVSGKERKDWLGGRYLSANWDADEIVSRRAEIERGDLLKVRMAVNTFPSS